MKRNFTSLFAVCSLLFALSWFSAVPVIAGIQDFTISSFEADYYLSRNDEGYSRLSARETIVARFPDFDQNHGILRALPKVYNGVTLGLDIESVTDESGQPRPFSSYTERGNLVLKIGDPDTFARGDTTYILNYSLKNVITFQKEHDELFWNTNGTQWPQAFAKITARLHVPTELADSLQTRQLCYTGISGSTDRACTMERLTDPQGNVTVTTKAENLGAYENVSFVVGWDSGTFTPDPWPARFNVIKWVIGGLLPLITFGAMFRQWRLYGKDPSGRGIIVPEYSPPDGMNALAADTLLREKFNVESISAGLIELAAAGYITIHESIEKKLLKDKRRYSLELKKPAKDLAPEQRELITKLFGGEEALGTQIDLSTQANKLYSLVTELNRALPKELTQNGYFRVEPRKSKGGYYVLGIVVLLAGFGLLFAVLQIGIGALAAGLIIVIFAGTMPARTKKGVDARERLLGLKEYISLAEADRIRYLQSPEAVSRYGKPTAAGTQIKLFESLLPYAMLFGLEKDWARQFEHLYAKPPEWFDSTSRSFTPIVLADSINTMSNQSTAAFSPPASSGGSGFSGGGSGGGGGGGGGGGW